jgi:hypothetical protein
MEVHVIYKTVHVHVEQNTPITSDLYLNVFGVRYEYSSKILLTTPPPQNGVNSTVNE